MQLILSTTGNPYKYFRNFRLQSLWRIQKWLRVIGNSKLIDFTVRITAGMSNVDKVSIRLWKSRYELEASIISWPQQKVEKSQKRDLRNFCLQSLSFGEKLAMSTQNPFALFHVFVRNSSSTTSSFISMSRRKTLSQFSS